jgi:hypothetical protein
MISQKTWRQIACSVQKVRDPLGTVGYLFRSNGAQDFDAITGGNNKTLTNDFAIDKPRQAFSASLV